MPRKVRDAGLESREERLRLNVRQRYWVGIRDGVALGYRRGTQGVGSWHLRFRGVHGRYLLRSIDDADDRQSADGNKVLSFTQAYRKAAELADRIEAGEGHVLTPAILAQAAERYLNWFRRCSKTTRSSEFDMKTCLPSEFMNRRIGSVTASELLAWVGAAKRSARGGKG